MDDGTSCRLFKFNERVPTSQSRRRHGHTLSLRLYTYDLHPSANGILLCNFNPSDGRLAGCKIIINYTYLLLMELTTRANIMYSSQQFKRSMRDVRQ
jgi:hypothetical protein